MLENWEARTFTRELIYLGFFNPGDEEISIPDNRPIRKSYILDIRPAFKTKTVRAQVAKIESCKML